MKHRLLLAAVLALPFALPAAANDTAQPDQHVKVNPAEFLQNKATIEQELRTGDLYREIGEQEKERVLAALDRMAGQLQGVTAMNQLTQEQRIQLFNDQELVNTLLTAARDESRLVCERRGTVGTRFKTNHCETVKQRRESARAAQDRVRMYMRPTMQGPGGG